MPKKVILSVINDISTDQRIHRIATALHEAGYEVLIVGRKLPESIPLPKRPYRMHRMRLLFKSGKLFYLAFNLRLFFFLLFQRANILNANDLDTLLANFLVSRIRNIPLVYDSHEYFTEVPELVHRSRTRKIWLTLEQWIFPKLKHTYTVNESIANIYRDKYTVDVKVVRNVPWSHKTRIPDAEKQNILIYQGALNVGRGIDLMIEAMTYLPNCQLWIAGKGDVEEELRNLVVQKELSDRVIFKGLIPMNQLAKITAQARLGFSLEEDLGKNYYYASPNKVYDYIQAGVPVLVADLPEMSRTVEQYKVGEILTKEERKPQILAKHIESMLSNVTLYKEYVENCLKASEVLNWENERTKLFEIYDGV